MNPTEKSGFWDEWNTFEIHHGNEDTFREMLRIKRTVSASFSQMHFNMVTTEIPSVAITTKLGDTEGDRIPGRVMSAVRYTDGQDATNSGHQDTSSKRGSLVSSHNPDEIDITVD